MKNKKEHWENVYGKRNPDEVSWYQPDSLHSMDFIKTLSLKKSAAILDVGGGDSHLAENLLAEGYNNIHVLDISETAIERAKKRLGKKAQKVNWIVADVANFSPVEKYDLWHDRATFHFLTQKKEVEKYMETLKSAVKERGYVILGTFSEKGPEKCSGIPIRQYSLHDLAELLKDEFEVLECENLDHITPSGAVQNFSFCSYRKLK